MKRLIRNADDARPELLIYGDIGENFWDPESGITAKRVADELKPLGKSKPITVRVNSPGGDVFAGMAIYSLLRDRKGDVEVKIDGSAASAASVIAAAGDSVLISETGVVMMHRPQAMAFGDKTEFERMVAALEAIQTSLVNAYVARTKADAETVTAWVDAETWWSADDAITHGFADAKFAGPMVTASLDRPWLKVPDRIVQAVAAKVDPKAVARIEALTGVRIAG